MRFALIDRILSYRQDQGIRAAKTLSQAEEYLMDHFPGYPVMPGVLMIEVMTQAASWHLRMAGDFRYSLVTLEKASHVRFGHFVTPGDTLLVDLQIRDLDLVKGVASFRGKGRIRPGGADPEGLALEDLSVACQAKLQVRGHRVEEVAPELPASLVQETEDRLRDSLRRELACLGFPALDPDGGDGPEAGGGS